ncbi:MAG: YraN family protein, partial [Halorhodospira sp.]
MNPQRRRRPAKETGRNAEDNARVYLEAQGLRTLASNFRTAQGEIDLVMTDGATTVFVEVRHRSHPGFGGAAASVDRRKRFRLQRAAAVWLGRHPTRARFDVIATDGDTIHWIRDA